MTVTLLQSIYSRYSLAYKTSFFFFFQNIRSVSPRSDSSEDSVFASKACAPRSSGRLKKMAAMFNREASFDDNRSDIYDDDEDRGFFQMNESDEGMITSLMIRNAVLSLQKVSSCTPYFNMQLFILVMFTSFFSEIWPFYVPYILTGVSFDLLSLKSSRTRHSLI